jgi:spoIIIJ-associated protein
MEDSIKSTVAELLKHLGLSFTKISVDMSDAQMIRADIDSTEASRLIGWHGETINSLQHLLKAIIRSKERMEKSPFIVLDVDGYRRTQEDRVRHIAEEKADFVRRKKTRVALPPMNPYFRRIVHLFIANTPAMHDLTTESIGEGDYRQIVLKLKEGSIDEGEELSPVISSDDPLAKELQSLENLDV